MAKSTTVLMQAALNVITGQDVGTPDTIQILEEAHDSATSSRWYCTGHGSDITTPKIILNTRTMWCLTTVSGSDAAQAAEIVAAMTSSDPAGTVTTDANVDPDIGP